jgi:hypothetical protein
LENFHAGGQPHANFTVLRTEFCDAPLREEIRTGYAAQIAKLRRGAAGLKDSWTAGHGGSELRKSRRYERLESVVIEKSESETLGQAQLNNFSAEGLMIRSGFAIPPGEAVKIRFGKPLLASASNVMASRVVWCRDFGAQVESVSRFGIGLSLVH